MTPKFDFYFKSVLENMEGNGGITAIAYFHGLKALLEEGDNFTLLTNRTLNRSVETMSCQFVYKGVRHIRAFASIIMEDDDIREVSATIFEVTPEGKTVDKLDTNAFHNPGTDPRGYSVSYDPHITTVEQFVHYVKSVLDRDDRDGDPTPPIPSAPIKPKIKKPVLV